jgi:hypothetical protein
MVAGRKTPTKEQKAWMKENGYTEAQLDSFWEENIETNSNIQMLSRCGRTWRDLNLSCIQGLPTLKERDLKRQQEQEEQDRLIKEEKAKLEADKHYYEKNFEKIMLDKIDNKENLTESELKRLIYQIAP